MFFKRRLLVFLPFSAAALYAYPAYGASLLFFSKPVVKIFNDLAAWLLSVAGGLALLMLVVGGIYYIISGSNPQNQTSAKRIITYAILGLGLTLISYAILIAIERIAVTP